MLKSVLQRASSRMTGVPSRCMSTSTASSETTEKVASILSASSQKPIHQKMKIPTKRAGHLLNQLNDEIVAQHKDKFPMFRAGDAIEIEMLTNKSSEKIQRMKGVVIGRRNRGAGSSFTIRNNISGVAFESKIQLYDPMIQSLKVLKEKFIHSGKKRVRRSKLYYLREKSAKYTTV